MSAVAEGAVGGDIGGVRPDSPLVPVDVANNRLEGTLLVVAPSRGPLLAHELVNGGPKDGPIPELEVGLSALLVELDGTAAPSSSQLFEELGRVLI